jgi:hypothetical protein
MKECRFLSLWLGRWARRAQAVIGPGVHCSLGRRNTAPLGARTYTADWAGVGTTGRGNFARMGQARPKHKHARSFSLLGKLASRRLHHILFLHLSLPACLPACFCQPLPSIPAGHAVRLTFAHQLITSSLPTAPHSLLVQYTQVH